MAKQDPNLNDIAAEVQKGDMTNDRFMAFVNVLMAREARLAEKEIALDAQMNQRNERRKRESENYTVAKIEAQKACKHLKGGAGRTRGQQRDPNVFHHTFTGGEQVIKCNGCQARWLPKDTKEYLFRNGNSIPNWTGIGWKEACEMVEDSSNKPSSSERFAVAVPSAASQSIAADVTNLQI